MKHAKDLLIAYSSEIAISPKNTSRTTPFSSSVYNTCYEYFLEVCQKEGLQAVLATSADIVGPGTVDAYWAYGGNWQRHVEITKAKTIFDKCLPKDSYEEKQFDLLINGSDIRVFNNYKLKRIFSDKLLTYKFFPEYSIPTVAVRDLSQKGVSNAITSLKQLTMYHANKSDFTDKFIIKDQFGAEGENVFLIENGNYLQRITKTLRESGVQTYVLQPFIPSDKGFLYKNYRGETDIRVQVIGDEIYNVYLRLAGEHTFKSNIHFGGKRINISLPELPQCVKDMAVAIIKELGGAAQLYSLDFMVSNSNRAYLVEGNYNPGLYWVEGDSNDEKEQKKLIERIVLELKKMTNQD